MIAHFRCPMCRSSYDCVRELSASASHFWPHIIAIPPRRPEHSRPGPFPSRELCCCCSLCAPAVGRTGRGQPQPTPRAPEPPGEWLRRSAECLEAAGRSLQLDAERSYWTEEDLEWYQWYLQRGAGGSSSHWGGPRVSLPPPWVGSEPQWAWTDTQWRAWREDFALPTGGLVPGCQPTTQAEEIHRIVTGKVTMLNCCPRDRAVMVCGRPVVVPKEPQYRVCFIMWFVATRWI